MTFKGFLKRNKRNIVNGAVIITLLGSAAKDMMAEEKKAGVEGNAPMIWETVNEIKFNRPDIPDDFLKFKFHDPLIRELNDVTGRMVDKHEFEYALNIVNNISVVAQNLGWADIDSACTQKKAQIEAAKKAYQKKEEALFKESIKSNDDISKQALSQPGQVFKLGNNYFVGCYGEGLSDTMALNKARENGTIRIMKKGFGSKTLSHRTCKSGKGYLAFVVVQSDFPFK